MQADAAVAALDSRNDCLICPVQGCVGRGGESQAAAWGEVLAPRQAAMPGAPLYRSGERLRALYTVRGGCIKTFTLDAEGNERIRGFYLPGEIVGLDALGQGSCPSTAMAVVPSQVCVAPLGDLRQTMLRVPQLAQRMIEQTSRELALALAVSGDYNAEQRLAAFLLNLRDRTGSGEILRLPMGQRDIGNYLRLATETVCRTLKGMERKGWVALGERKVTLLAEARLRGAAEPVNLPGGGYAKAA
jgi:CRP/FNR family transcriptional regulator